MASAGGPEEPWPTAFASHIRQSGLDAQWQFDSRHNVADGGAPVWTAMDDDLTLVLEQAWRQPAELGDSFAIECTEDCRTVWLINNKLSHAGTPSRYMYRLKSDGTGTQRNLLTRAPPRAVQRVEVAAHAPAHVQGAVVIVRPPAKVEPKQHKCAAVLEPESEQHSHALAELEKSLRGEAPVLQIEEASNRELRAIYDAKKAAMGARAGERWLWHGTTAESAAKILATGFNRSFCGVNATVYGEGVYFAASALLSMRYAKADEHGRRYLFLCSVLCGRTGQGCRGLKEPPPLCVAPPS